MKPKLPLTKTLIELADSGQSYEAIAAQFGLSAAQVKEAIEKIRPLVAMNQTMSLTQMEAKLGTPRQTLHHRLTKAGYTPISYERGETKPLPPDDVLIKMYQDMPMMQMAKELNINSTKIQQRLDQLGVDTSLHYGKGGQKPKLPDTARVKQLFHGEGKSAEEIATMFKATVDAVYKRLRG